MGKVVESVLVSSQLPRGVLNANLNPSQGTYTFDPVTKVPSALSLCVVHQCLNFTVTEFCLFFLIFINLLKLLSWDVGKINPQKLPSLKGTMSLQAGASKPDENPTFNIQFKIQQMAISGGTPAHAQVV